MTASQLIPLISTIISSATAIVIAVIKLNQKIGKFGKTIDHLDERIGVIEERMQTNMSKQDMISQLEEVKDYFSTKISNNFLEHKNALIEKNNKFIEVMKWVMEKENYDSLPHCDLVLTNLVSGFENCKIRLKEYLSDEEVESYYSLHVMEFKKFLKSLEVIYQDFYNSKERRILKVAKDFMLEYNKNYLETFKIGD